VHRLIDHLRSNLIGWLALFVALGGTSYAAFGIPRASVGARQLKNHSITPIKFNPADINGSVRAWAIVGAGGNVIAGAGKPTVTTIPSVPGTYSIRWGVVLPKTCATVANVDARTGKPTETVPLPGGTTENIVAGYVSQVSTGTSKRPVKPRRLSSTGLVTLNQAGQPTPLAFDVVVTC
jgi:hypothetical protein